MTSRLAILSVKKLFTVIQNDLAAVNYMDYSGVQKRQRLAVEALLDEVLAFQLISEVC